MPHDSLDDNLLDGFLQKEDPTQDYKHIPALPEMKESYSDSSMDSLLQDLQDSKIMNTKEVIADIESLIEERKTLQSEVFGDVDKIMMGMNNFMVTQGDKIDAVKQAELREKMLDIEAFKLNEKINTFRDIADLKKELRDRMHEFREQEQHQHMIGNLLGD